MNVTVVFILNSVLLGVGLAMDAVSVSVVNGFRDPKMSSRRKNVIAGTFGVFQTMMPLIGWAAVTFFLQLFRKAEPCIPWIAFVLLLFIGGKMLIEGIGELRNKEDCREGGENDVFPAEGSGTDDGTEDGAKNASSAGGSGTERKVLGKKTLLIQGIATSIDALSVGFTISEYGFGAALAASLIIGLVTFILCRIALVLGIRVGRILNRYASLVGGIILIGIGVEILLTGILG